MAKDSLQRAIKALGEIVYNPKWKYDAKNPVRIIPVEDREETNISDMLSVEPSTSGFLQLLKPGQLVEVSGNIRRIENGRTIYTPTPVSMSVKVYEPELVTAYYITFENGAMDYFRRVDITDLYVIQGIPKSFKNVDTRKRVSQTELANASKQGTPVVAQGFLNGTLGYGFRLDVHALRLPSLSIYNTDAVTILGTPLPIGNSFWKHTIHPNYHHRK